MTDTEAGAARQTPDRSESSGAADEWAVFILPLLWRRRLLIAAATLLGGLAAFALTLPQPAVYEASAVLMVNRPKASQSSAPPASTASIVQLLRSRALAASVISDLRLDQPPRSISPAVLATSLLIVEEIRSTDLIRVRIRLDDAELAAQTANRLVDRAVEFNRTINQREAVLAREALRSQLDEARARLQELEQQLPMALAWAPSASSASSLQESGRQLPEASAGQRGRFISLTVEIEAGKARLAKAEQELAKHEKTINLTWNLLNLQGTSQVINPVADDLERQIAASRTTLAALERERADLVRALGLKGPAVSDLRLLYEKEVELSKVELEYSLAKLTYTELSTRYDQARVAVTTSSAQLQVVDPATGPGSRVGPPVRLNVAVGLAAGFTLAVVLSVLAAVLVLPPTVATRRRG